MDLPLWKLEGRILSSKLGNFQNKSGRADLSAKHNVNIQLQNEVKIHSHVPTMHKYNTNYKTE